MRSYWKRKQGAPRAIPITRGHPHMSPSKTQDPTARQTLERVVGCATYTPAVREWAADELLTIWARESRAGKAPK